MKFATTDLTPLALKMRATDPADFEPSINIPPGMFRCIHCEGWACITQYACLECNGGLMTPEQYHAAILGVQP